MHYYFHTVFTVELHQSHDIPLYHRQARTLILNINTAWVYGVAKHSQHSFRYWFVAWWPQCTLEQALTNDQEGRQVSLTWRQFMMTSSNGNIFRVTDHLCGEFTGDRWIPHTKASDAELWCFFICVWINGWVNNCETGDLRRYRAHCDVTVMLIWNAQDMYL